MGYKFRKHDPLRGKKRKKTEAKVVEEFTGARTQLIKVGRKRIGNTALLQWMRATAFDDCLQVRTTALSARFESKIHEKAPSTADNHHNSRGSSLTILLKASN